MTRIERLHRGPLKENRFQLGLDSIYQFRDLLSIDYIPSMSADTHTMYTALDEFVRQKLPVNEIVQTVSLGGIVEVHGIYPRHFDLVYANEISAGELVEVSFYHKPTTRKYNIVRPRFFMSSDRRKFMATVAPGSDYIKHYGTMLRHLIENAGFHADVKLHYYPMAFHSLPFWTHLYRGFVHAGDLVIIGYVDEIYSEISAKIDLIPVSNANNPYLESRRFKLPGGRAINFLGVNFSFWGNLSQVIAESICRCGASEIIYVGKLGSMTTPDSLYRDLFIPTRFVTLSHKNIVSNVTQLKNNLVEMFPELDTGLHVSVPTVLEEDYIQRDVCELMNAKSIDNEISQIAYAIANFNISNGTDVSYSSFHFATDYVRPRREAKLRTEFDLSTNRTESALRSKDATLKKCATHLIEYLRCT